VWQGTGRTKNDVVLELFLKLGNLLLKIDHLELKGELINIRATHSVGLLGVLISQ
jgi:hypothetical protein